MPESQLTLNPQDREPLELDPSADPFAPESIKQLVARYGSPLFVIDAERVRRQYRRLAAALPGVDLHYALKPLPHGSVIDTLHAEGAFFDLEAPVKRMGAMHVPIPFSPPLEDVTVPTEKTVLAAALALCGKD